MNPTIITQFGNPDPNAAPLNIQQLINLLNTLVTSNMQGGPFSPYVVSSDQPADTTLVWIQLDSPNGKPTGTKIYYSGHWRRIYNGMYGEVRGFSGDPTVTADWGATGLGVIGGTYDGWHICNGKDGPINGVTVPDLSDKFILSASMGNATNKGYVGGQWVSNMEDGSTFKNTGGHNTVTLDAAHTFTPNNLVTTLYKRSAPGDTADAAGNIGGITPAAFPINMPVTGGVNTSPTPIDIVNPYYAQAWMIFVGY